MSYDITKRKQKQSHEIYIYFEILTTTLYSLQKKQHSEQ